MLRARARLARPVLCMDAGGKGRVRGERQLRRRHHVGADGVYRGVRYFLPKTDLVGTDEE